MRAITGSLKRRERELKYKAAKEREVRGKIRQVLASIFGPRPEARYLRGFYLKNNTLFVETKNKTAANELFLKKPEILEGLKGLVRDIIVR